MSKVTFPIESWKKRLQSIPDWCFRELSPHCWGVYNSVDGNHYDVWPTTNKVKVVGNVGMEFKNVEDFIQTLEFKAGLTVNNSMYEGSVVVGAFDDTNLQDLVMYWSKDSKVTPLTISLKDRVSGESMSRIDMTREDAKSLAMYILENL